MAFLDVSIPVKNLTLLVEAFPRVAIPVVNPFRLLVVGDGADKSRLEATVPSTGMRTLRDICRTSKLQVLPYLRAMDVFLLTSLREQMPLTVLEAMAVEIPVISTRVGENSLYH